MWQDGCGDDGVNAWGAAHRHPSNSAFEAPLPAGGLRRFPQVDTIELALDRILRAARGGGDCSSPRPNCGAAGISSCIRLILPPNFQRRRPMSSTGKMAVRRSR